MTRINVYETVDLDDHLTGQRRLAGHFDRDKATAFYEDTRWDGEDNISVVTGSEWDHERLYRTARGRWVLHTWTQRAPFSETYEYIIDSAARDWLLRNELDGDVEEYFGEIEEEVGPGRPGIGKPVLVRLGDELITKADERAAADDISRAELIRRAVAQYVA